MDERPAEQWLQGYLAAKGGRALEKDVLDAGGQAGHDAAALRRARAGIGAGVSELAPGTRWSRWWWIGDAGYTADDAKAVGVSARTWPYGPNIDLAARAAMVAWAKGYGLRLARSSAPLCATWLEKGRCRGCRRGSAHRGSLHPGTLHEVLRIDHVSGWTREGVPAVVVNHPYSLWGDGLAMVAEANANPALVVSVVGSSWYSTATMQVEMWNRQAWDAVVAARTARPR